MKSAQSKQSRKHAANLTLKENLVSQAKEMTKNLSGVAEQLLTDYVQKQHKSRQEKLHNANAVSQAWNHFNEQWGAFADEYPTL